MKAIPCTLYTNSPLTGHMYAPIKCKSIREALKIAKKSGSPYRIEVKGKTVRTGWFA